MAKTKHVKTRFPFLQGIGCTKKAKNSVLASKDQLAGGSYGYHGPKQ
jgi:hypothetical protein